MRFDFVSIILSVVVATALSVACTFDTEGLSGNPVGDGSVNPDRNTSGDGAAPDVSQNADGSRIDRALLDVHVSDAYVPDAYLPDSSTTCVPAQCPLGCHASNTRCNRVLPAHFTAQDIHDNVSAGLTVSAGETVTVDTDSGSVTGNTLYRPAGNLGAVVQGIYYDQRDQTNGPDIAVFGITALSIPANAKIQVTGSHPVAFYVTGDVDLAGIIEAKAQGQTPGPGGSAGGSVNGGDGEMCGPGGAGGGGGQNWTLESGGGGGGNGFGGGDGGDVDYWVDFTHYVVNGGMGGTAIATSIMSALRGGCGGGGGGGPDPGGNNDQGGDGGAGGGGGGAVQVTANGTITIHSGGGIDVGGGKGSGGHYGAGGGGGGAGGTILLQAPDILNGGLLAANGGGGGAGGENIHYPQAESGNPGGFDNNQAAGGNGLYDDQSSCGGYGCYGGDGGHGGGGGDGNGDHGENDVPNSGGGGGGGGKVLFYYHVSINPGDVSPDNATTSQQGLTAW
jgi:hypothetical protein